MALNKSIIVRFFRYLWIAISVAVILFVLSQAIYTKRTLEYYLDFSKPVSKDIRGWYPEIRLSEVSIASQSGAFDLVAEPVYMKIYTPIDFKNMNINGGIFPHQEKDIRLGLRQTDGSWEFKNIVIENFQFSSDFDLSNAQIRNNQLEIILSVPGMQNPSRVSLVNDWKIILSR